MSMAEAMSALPPTADIRSQPSAFAIVRRGGRNSGAWNEFDPSQGRASKPEQSFRQVRPSSSSTREHFLFAEATMSHARPMHHQQLPTVGSVAWLIIAVVFIMLVVLSGALALLGLLLSNIISYLM